MFSLSHTWSKLLKINLVQNFLVNIRHNSMLSYWAWELQIRLHQLSRLYPQDLHVLYTLAQLVLEQCFPTKMQEFQCLVVLKLSYSDMEYLDAGMGFNCLMILILDWADGSSREPWCALLILCSLHSNSISELLQFSIVLLPSILLTKNCCFIHLHGTSSSIHLSSLLLSLL